MKRKCILLLVLSIVLLLSMLGCQQGENYKLIVYADPGHDNIAHAARMAMLAEYPELEIEVRSFDRFDDYRLILQTEMAAGKGPDVLLFSPDAFVDLCKAMDAGVFQDLNPWFESDPDLSELNLNSSVFDGCIYKGQRLYVPLSYLSYTAMTTKEALQELGISLSESPTFEEWSDAVWSAARELKEKLIVRIMLDHAPSRYAALFGLEMYDPNTKEFLIDSATFRQALELYKAVYPIDPTWFDPSIELFKSRDLVFGLEVSYESRLYGLLENLRTEKPFTFRVPSPFEDRPSAYPYIMAAMGSGCKNQDLAYQMIRLMLSKELQKRSFIYIPINQDAEKERFNQTKATDSLTISTEDILLDLNNIHYMHPFPAPLLEMIDATMSPWFLDQEEYDVCLENLRNRLEVYINE